MIDPTRKYRIDIAEAEAELEKLKKEDVDYMKRPEFRQLLEIIRHATARIDHFKKMMDRGVKF